VGITGSIAGTLDASGLPTWQPSTVWCCFHGGLWLQVAFQGAAKHLRGPFLLHTTCKPCLPLHPSGNLTKHVQAVQWRTQRSNQWNTKSCKGCWCCSLGRQGSLTPQQLLGGMLAFLAEDPHCWPPPLPPGCDPPTFHPCSHICSPQPCLDEKMIINRPLDFPAS
jgi:hypothetical protein